MYKKLLLISFFSLLATCLFAQNNAAKLLSVNFNQADVGQVVKDLESKTNYHFYYDVKDFDSLQVTITISQKPIDYILKACFTGTAFNYAITNTGEIFLTKNWLIQTQLSDSAFVKLAKTSEKPKPKKATGSKRINIVDDMESKVPQARIENKIYQIGIASGGLTGGKVILSGYVKDAKTGQPIVGASLYVTDANTGAATDEFGYYLLTLPKGPHTINIKSLGNKDTFRKIILNAAGKLDIELQEQVLALKQVKISDEKVANVKSTRMGVERMTIKTIREIPAVFGEADILRAVQLLPGVQTVGEATTGFNVRGGAADQNLIIFNGSTIYNPAHFFGFFSAFNPDVVKDVELYKSTIPEKFGGRLSSVLDVTNREGNKKKFTGTAGIGLLTSRLSVEGPIVKDRTSFLFGGRVTYSNWLLKLLPDSYKNSDASFYDFNLDISHKIDEKNNIYVYSYISQDKFKLNSDTTYNYNNKNIAIKWKHNYNDKLFGVISTGFDRYQYQNASDGNPVNAYQFNYNINQTNLKADFTYYPSSKHTFTFGISSIYYKLNPGSYQPNDGRSLVVGEVLESQQALESALYLGDKFDIMDALSVSAGLRFSLYNFLGPKDVNYYASGAALQTSNLTGVQHYNSNQLIKTYAGPEIRLSARYSLTSDLSVKAGYNTLRQYIHLLSNSASISPSDVYQLSDPNIKPQTGDQISIGLFKNLSSNTIETSVEVYYRRINNYLDYKSGAQLVLNPHIETDVLNTKGKAYGVELLARKTAGLLTGLVSYTYSRTFLQQNDALVLPLINSGNYYPANYDKPHDFNFAGSYHFTHRYSFSLNLVYSTGRPITLPIGKYFYAGSERAYYSDRNQYRVPDYFRSDFSINVDGNHKLNQTFHSSWTVGVYNLTANHNAYSTYFVQQNGVINGYKLSIFANAIPFINYNIKF
jgi:hypothetical protein